uniref:Uncharacterized protein n=1 Tax=Lepeophtheirus salmonis TaxID=72036 RepID=A0A0K2UDZ7_LEPSM
MNISERNGKSILKRTNQDA